MRVWILATMLIECGVGLVLAHGVLRQPDEGGHLVAVFLGIGAVDLLRSFVFRSIIDARLAALEKRYGEPIPNLWGRPWGHGSHRHKPGKHRRRGGIIGFLVRAAIDELEEMGMTEEQKRILAEVRDLRRTRPSYASVLFVLFVIAALLGLIDHDFRSRLGF